MVKELEISGRLNDFLRKGIIPLLVNNNKHINEYYNEQLNQLKEISPRDYKIFAMQNTCDKFECEKDTVYRAIKIMKSNR